MKNKIKFNDLSGWLKAGVICAWIIGSIYTLTLLMGFIGELLILTW